MGILTHFEEVSDTVFGILRFCGDAEKKVCGFGYSHVKPARVGPRPFFFAAVPAAPEPG